MTQQRQTCSHCFTTVGTMPNGELRPYATTVTLLPHRKVFHRCIDLAACNERRRAAEMGNLHLR